MVVAVVVPSAIVAAVVVPSDLMEGASVAQGPCACVDTGGWGGARVLPTSNLPRSLCTLCVENETFS